MISLDWKERLKIDTEDFVSRKLIRGDFDIDIVYNAYPKRIDNKIPSEVVVYVAKILSRLITKDSEKHIDFYTYLWNKKGDNGRIIFTYIMKAVVKKKPQLFLDYLKNILAKSDDLNNISALLNKAVFPVVKKDPKKNIDLIYNWLNIDNPDLHKGILNLFIKVGKEDSSLITYVFRKMERGWLYPTTHTLRDSTLFLKSIYKIDPDFYFSVYDNYHNSRNPVFVEILCHALSPVKEEPARQRIEEYMELWSKSGNAKIIKRKGKK